MKEKIKCLLIFLSSLMLIFSFSGCVDEKKETDTQKVIYTEYFKVNINKAGGYAVILGMTEHGAQQEILVIPSYIEGLPVKAIGGDMRLHYKLVQSNVLTKLYISGNIERIDARYLDAGNLKEVIVIPSDALIGAPGSDYPKYFYNPKGCKIYIYNSCYESCKNLYNSKWEAITTDFSIHPANVTFLYNYQSAPNQGLYWLDNAADEVLHTIPENPLREGYTFKGWFTDKACLNEFDINNQKIPTNGINLYAGWLN